MTEEKSKAPSGLPPAGVWPPVLDADQCKPGRTSLTIEHANGGKSLWDPCGGEWRWLPGEARHGAHWDHNAHDRPNSPWVKVSHRGVVPLKA